MRKTIIEYLADHANGEPNNIAVVVGSQKTSYNDLWRYVKGFCRYLILIKGVRKGDRIVIKASQSLEYVIAYMSVHLAGGIFVPTEKTISKEAFEHIIDYVNAKVVISDIDYPGSIRLKDILDVALEYYDDSFIPEFPSLDDSADILFTTGTTGVSKGVELTHNAISATAENLIHGLEMKADTRLVVPGPLNHANPIRKVFTTIANGSTIILLNGMMNLKAFFEALDYPDGTIACCLPPAMIRTLFQITGDKLSEYADKIDFIESATSPLPEPDKIKLCNLLPHTRLYNNYGSSEAASVCMYNYNMYKDKANCVGRPTVNSRIMIVDEEYKEIHSSKDKLGLIACEGDINMKGYVDSPDLTRTVLRDGIVYTSDIGYIDDEGFVYVIGRKGDVINVGGLKVAPTEVESAALGYDDIDDCICVPVDDQITGKALKLCVVMKSDAVIDAREIKKYLSEKLESFKVPKYIVKIDQVPRTYNGKIDRKQLL